MERKEEREPFASHFSDVAGWYAAAESIVEDWIKSTDDTPFGHYSRTISAQARSISYTQVTFIFAQHTLFAEDAQLALEPRQNMSRESSDVKEGQLGAPRNLQWLKCQKIGGSDQLSF